MIRPCPLGACGADHAARLVAAFSLVLLGAACGSSNTGEGGTGEDAGASSGSSGGGGDGGVVDKDSAQADTGSGEDSGGGEDAAQDAGGDAMDAGTADGGEQADSADAGGADSGEPLPGEDYAACASNTDCDKGICIPGTGNGMICAEICTDSCKKEGYVCKLVVPPGGSDSTSICVPKAPNLCNPCDKNAQCVNFAYPKAACVDKGDAGAFCGLGCQSDDGCPVDYACKDAQDVAGNAVKQCVPKGDSICACSEKAIAAKLQTRCYKETGAGAKCEGVRKCLPGGEQGAPAGGGLSACLAATAGEEKCDGKDNDCDGDTDEETCDDKESCTTDSCDAKTAQCKHENQSGPCDADGSKCTVDDACSNGVCKAGDSLKCNDNNDCTADKCDDKKGCDYQPKTGEPCNADDNKCTQNDSCDDQGTCNPGKKKACTDDNPCVTGVCKVTTGKCSYDSIDGTLCNDGNPCTIKDKCQSEICKGTPNTCDDANPCTDDACAKKTGCMHSPQSGPCEDGDACTVKSVCQGSKCVGVGTKDCDDGDPCTEDGCDASKGCLNKPLSNKPCSDGNACTTGDICKEGKCRSGVDQCKCKIDSDCKDDGNLCNGTLFCNKAISPFKCEIKKDTIVVCAGAATDGPCKKTSCAPTTGKCVTEINNLDGKACTDGDLCTKGDICKGGACVTDKVNCDDKNPCTDDSCDPKKGCTHVDNNAGCDADGDKCTVDDICSSGNCDAGKKKSCDDGNPCTTDSCDKTSGACKVQNRVGGCDDGNPCTAGDKCGTKAMKWVCVSGPAPNCDDGNPCTEDTCDPTGKGCKSVVVKDAKVACYSGAPKTRGVGTCKAGYQLCDAAGKPSGKCVGEVLPAPKDLCKGADDDCNSTPDEGCKPEGYYARFGNAVIAGKGTKYAARVFVGGSTAAGASSGSGKVAARFGFYEWLAAALSKKK